MNKFTVSIKQGGVWQAINATPVFPFSWGELLDERLDEAYITVYDSPEANYKRLTDAKISITNGTKVKDEYFIIASDNAVELPVGSGKYKHEIYLIERTKLLEGIFCSTITFTNTKSNNYLGTGKTPWEDVGGLYEYSWTVPSDFTSPIPRAVENGKPFTFPSAEEMAEDMLPFVSAQIGGNAQVSYFAQFTNAAQTQTKTYYTGCSYEGSEESKSFAMSAPVTVTPTGSIVLNYTLCYSATTLGTEYYFAYFLRFSLNAITNHLPLKRWSITDCITRACELAEPLFAGQAPKYRLDGVEYDNNGKVQKPYEEGTLAAKYDKVFAPEFTATEDTLREQLKLILSYVHAEPWLDENDVIHVTDYGNVSESAAKTLPFVFNSVTSHINEYCTEIRSHAQNLASSLGYARGVTTDPGIGLYRSIRSDTAYVRINENNGVAITPAPIYSVEQVMCGIATTDGSGWRVAPVDITPYVFEETTYNYLASYAGGYPYSKQFAIYYTQGSPNLKGLFYKAPNAINTAVFSPFAIANILSSVTGISVGTLGGYLTASTGGAASLVFSITYKPISNHFVSHGKQLYVKDETPFMQLYNQSENLVESQYYGENLRGVAARLGNIEKERTFILRDIDDVPRVGDMLDGYAISAVSCELYPFDIKCTVGLTKDFNRISEYVGINSQKRMYEVSERNAADRNILIKETLVIGDAPEEYEQNAIWKDLTPFYIVFDSATPNRGYRISTATFTGRNRSGTHVGSLVALPVIARALGNVVTLNFSMKDNYSAGAKTQMIEGDSDVEGRWENDVPYSDYYGRAWFAEIFFQRGNVAATSSSEAVSKFAYSAPDTTLDIPGIGITAFGAGAIHVYNHLLRKDNRERISYNVELDIKTNREDIIVGTALADLCGWVNDADVAPVIYYFDASKYTIGKFDKIYTPHADDDTQGGSFTSEAPNASSWKVTKSSNGQRMTLTVKPRGIGMGWVICTPISTETVKVEDEDGNPSTETYTTGGEILLASNSPISSPISLDFYIAK